jgi:hypothetical protein
VERNGNCTRQSLPAVAVVPHHRCVLSTKTTPLSIHFGAHLLSGSPENSARKRFSSSQLLFCRWSCMRKKEVCWSPPLVVFPVLLQPSPSLSTGSFVLVHTLRVKPGARRPYASQKFFYPRNGGKLSLWTNFHASLPCARHMAVSSDLTSLKFFTFSAFFGKFYLSSLTTNSLRTEACCKWSRCDAAAESNRRRLSCLGLGFAA